MAPIPIPAGTIDPSAQERECPDASGSNYILIQCAHRLDPAEHLEFEKLEVQVQLVYDEDSKTNHCTYLCRYKPNDLDIIRAKPFVLHAFVYPEQCVVSEILEPIECSSNYPGCQSGLASF